jgi:hypothetical protein
MNIALSPTHFFATDERRHALAAVSLAVLAGGATQALFWKTGLGLNFFVWDVFVLAASVTLFRRPRTAGAAGLGATAWGAIGACLLLGFSIVRYASAWTLFIAAPVVVVTLHVLPLLLRERVSLAELSRLPSRALVALVDVPEAIFGAARLPAVALGGVGSGVLGGLSRGLLLGLPTAGLFALLLASDTDFARSLEHVRAALGDVTLFAGFSLATGATYLVTDTLHRRRRRLALRATPEGEIPYRAPPSESSPVIAAPVGRVSVVTWATVVGQVTLVFALFVAANLRHLFGGEAVVRAPGSVTYAAYLHAGFAELLCATILSVCLVLAGHALLRPRGDAALDAPVPGGRLLATLEGALLVLTGVTVASCWQRLRIYEDAYGASHLRLGVAFVELSVLGVLALTLVKVFARAWTGHAGALLALGAGIAVLATGFNTDAYVARTNLDRAAAGRPLDVAYLASLSGDARAALDHPFVKRDPALAARLEASFCRPARDLRSFRGLGQCPSGPFASEDAPSE